MQLNLKRKRQMGKKVLKDVFISFRVTKEEKQKIVNYCKQNNVSVSFIMNNIIDVALRNSKVKEQTNG